VERAVVLLLRRRYKHAAYQQRGGGLTNLRTTKRHFPTNGDSQGQPGPRVTGTDQYRTILAEIHDQQAGGGGTNNYYMRFASALEQNDRLLFDGINYWTSAP
jgi:hypothetical protein